MVVHVDGCPVDGCPLTLVGQRSAQAQDRERKSGGFEFSRGQIG